MHPNRSSSLELFGEVSDLAAGAGMLIFTLAPFALPVPALTALLAVALLITSVVAVVLAAPFLLARRWLRSRDRPSGDRKPSGSGDGETGTPRRRSAAALSRTGFPSPAELDDLGAPASLRAQER